MGGVVSRKNGTTSQKRKFPNSSKRNTDLSNSADGNGKIETDTSQSDYDTRADDAVIRENEKREIVSLFTDKNISMDFILEMKEAFLFFDKVRCH